MITIRMVLFSMIIIGLVGVSSPAIPIHRGDDIADQPNPPDAKLQLRIKELEDQLASQIRLNGFLTETDANSAKLRVHISGLEARIAFLEQQLNDRPRHSVPSNWSPRTFNGMQYYIVPCDEKPRP